MIIHADIKIYRKAREMGSVLKRLSDEEDKPEIQMNMDYIIRATSPIS